MYTRDHGGGLLLWWRGVAGFLRVGAGSGWSWVSAERVAHAEALIC